MGIFLFVEQVEFIRLEENEMQTYTYKIFEDGYDIYREGDLIITQRTPYDKLFLPDGTYEENAEAQIASLENSSEPTPAVPTEEEKLRADVDYLALIADVDLPSQKEEE